MPKFVKGQSGNPAGRPPHQENTYIRDLCRGYAAFSFERLKSIIENESANESARVTAIRLIWEHGYGKPIQQLEVRPGESNPENMTHHQMFEAFKVYTLPAPDHIGHLLSVNGEKTNDEKETVSNGSSSGDTKLKERPRKTHKDNKKV